MYIVKTKHYKEVNNTTEVRFYREYPHADFVAIIPGDKTQVSDYELEEYRRQWFNRETAPGEHLAELEARVERREKAFDELVDKLRAEIRKVETLTLKTVDGTQAEDGLPDLSTVDLGDLALDTLALETEDLKGVE